jgi:hypothetical protein
MLALARGWENDPDTLTILKARAQADEHQDVRKSAVLALARGWKNDLMVQNLLKEMKV